MAGLIGLIKNHLRGPYYANFYVETEQLASACLRDGGHHVPGHAIYLGSFETYELEPRLNNYFVRLRSKYKGTTFLIEIKVSEYYPLGDLRRFLSAFDSVDLQLSIVVILPAIEDLEYWAALRDYNGHLRFGIKLGLGLCLSQEFVARYKTLSVDALLVGGFEGTVDVAVKMAAKRSPPDIIIEEDDRFGNLVKYAKRRVVSWHVIRQFSDMLIDPLQPLTTEMDMEVYENFETDDVKYSQYDAAIKEAICDLRRKSTTLTILVIGPGRGPLLRSVLTHREPNDMVVAVEKNRKCMELLVEVVRGHANVTLYYGDVRDLKRANYDLVISELLGSFGCNEACPEILQHLGNLSLIFIPLEYCSFLQPIYTDFLLRNITRPYLVSLNSSIPVGEIERAFFHCQWGNRLNQKSTISIHKGRSDSDPNLDFANALLGFFEAELYKSHRISVLPNASLDEKCESWYPMIFPIGKAKIGDKVIMSRHSDGRKMWYEWTVGDRLYNVGGTYSVALH